MSTHELDLRRGIVDVHVIKLGLKALVTLKSLLLTQVYSTRFHTCHRSRVCFNMCLKFDGRLDEVFC